MMRPASILAILAINLLSSNAQNAIENVYEKMEQFATGQTKSSGLSCEQMFAAYEEFAKLSPEARQQLLSEPLK